MVIVLIQFEFCLPTNGRTPTTNRCRRKISPYTAHKLTRVHVPRGIKTRDPSTRAVKAALYRPNHKINSGHVMRVEKESFLNFRVLQNQSSLHLHYTCDE